MTTEAIVGTTCPVESAHPHILLAVISGNHHPSTGTVGSMMNAVTGNRTDLLVSIQVHGTSMLTRTFNYAWLEALNSFAYPPEDGTPPYTHFAMIHDDVACEPGWLGLLYDILTREDADVLSTVLPIKDTNGLTSTGLCYADVVRPILNPHGFPGNHPTVAWARRRLTIMESTNPRLPRTFTGPDLAKLFQEDSHPPHPPEDAPILINTGAWICRLGPWCLTGGVNEGPMYFWCYNMIFRDPMTGRLVHDEITEDWAFSRDLSRVKPPLRIMATLEVRAKHQGIVDFPNFGVWGTMQYDKPCMDSFAALSGNPVVSPEGEADVINASLPTGASPINSSNDGLVRRIVPI